MYLKYINNSLTHLFYIFESVCNNCKIDIPYCFNLLSVKVLGAPWLCVVMVVAVCLIPYLKP